MSAPDWVRARFRFAKTGPVRFTSHRDFARILERSLRIARAPVVYSEGFSPRPRLHFGLALPTTYESRAEYVEIRLRTPDDGDPDSLLAGVMEGLGPALPPGLDVTAAGYVDLSEPSLQESVGLTGWLIEVAGDPTNASDAVSRTLAAREIVITRERKGKAHTEDVRPAIARLALATPSELTQLSWTPSGPVLSAELATQTRSCRPSELVEAMGGLEETRVIRTHQWILAEGRRREPIPLAAPSPGQAMELAR